VRRWGPAAALAALAGLALGCAGVGSRGAAPPYRFPTDFRASQVVALEEPGGRHELIASVRRSGDEHQVTLFDPVFAVPLLSARAQGGEVSEELLAPGPRPGDGKRLAELLRDVFGRDYVERGGTAEASGWSGRARLSGLPPGSAACRFPAEIEMVPRIGQVRVRVRTLDVTCGD
jgi:hypothetical protein